eukprot:COSAG02_NODE_56921_length_283_cov_0.641304_1_plen_49_part_01
MVHIHVDLGCNLLVLAAMLLRLWFRVQALLQWARRCSIVVPAAEHSSWS